MIDPSLIANQIQKSVREQLQRKFKPIFKIELHKVFKNELAPILKISLVDAYDRLISISESNGGSRAVQHDPLSLRALRPLFVEQLNTEIQNNVRFEGEELVVELGNKSLLGFDLVLEPPEGPPISVDVLSFYVDGVVGDFAFIDRDLYIFMRSSTGDPSVFRNYGRLGEGFMIPREDYVRERWDEFAAPFADVRHPISGFPPYRGFEEAVKNIDINNFVEKAVRNTFKELNIKVG